MVLYTDTHKAISDTMQQADIHTSKQIMVEEIKMKQNNKFHTPITNCTTHTATLL